MPGKTERQAEVERILLMLAVYFQKQLTDLEIEIYQKGLAELQLHELKHAATQVIKTSRFFPKVAELLELGAPKVKAIEDRAEVQAAHVLEAVARYGLNNKPKFEDAITAWLLQGRFSWRALCDMNPSEAKWFVKEFVQAYRTFSDEPLPLRLEAPDRVAGLLKGIGG